MRSPGRTWTGGRTSSPPGAGGEGFGGDVKDLSGDARGFARKYKLNYVSVRDGSGAKTWNSYGLTGVPETYFLDARGRIVAHIPGAVSAQTLEEGIATITKPSRGGTLQGGAHVTP